MRKLLALIVLLCLPSLASAQAYRFSSVQITGTTDSALTVTGGIICCTNRFAVDAVNGNISDPAGTVVGITDALSVAVTTQAVSTTPLVEISSAWNSSGNTFTAIDLNIQGTAYAAASQLMNLRLNNTSVFSVNPAGNVTFAGVLTGNGSGLTNFSAAQLTTGTVPSGRLSGTYTISVSGGSFNGTTVTGTTGLFSSTVTSNSGTSTFAGLSVTGAATVGGTLNVTGGVTTNAGVTSLGFLYPGRVDVSSTQNSWYLGSHGTYGLYTNTGMYIAGAFYASYLIDTSDPAFYLDPSGASRLGAVTLGTASTSSMVGNWDYSSGGLGGGSPQIRPSVDNSGSVGTNTARWNLIRGVTILSGDLQFENGWTITESYKVGISQPGLAILDEDESLVMFIPKPDKVHSLPYVRTTKAQRARMDATPKDRVREAETTTVTPPDATGRTRRGAPIARDKSPAVEPMPDPRRARVGGGK